MFCPVAILAIVSIPHLVWRHIRQVLKEKGGRPSFLMFLLRAPFGARMKIARLVICVDLASARDLCFMRTTMDDSDLWCEMKELLAQHDDDFLQLIEALPDYDRLEINEDAYRTEGEILSSDRE